MKPRYLLLLCISLFVGVGINHAQELTTNELGEKIVVYPDGTWRYAEPADLQAPSLDIEKEKEDDSDLERAIQIAEAAAAAESDAIRAEEDAKYERLLIEDELSDAEESDDFFDDEIKEIKERLKAAKKKEKQAKSKRKVAVKKAKKASALLTMSEVARKKALLAYESENVIVKPSDLVDKQPTKKPKKIIITNNPPSSAPVPILATYDKSKDPLYNPPGNDCSLTFDGMDEFTGKKRKDVAKQLFFAHTNEELRPVFKEDDYMTCTGYLSSLSGGLKFLTLNILISSKTAQREYGILEKGSQINIKLINGENVRLTNTKTNMGTENPLEGSVTYKAVYHVSSADEKKLKKSEVDKVRIIWSSGYEDYEIFELDFFKYQFACLESN